MFTDNELRVPVDSHGHKTLPETELKTLTDTVQLSEDEIFDLNLETTVKVFFKTSDTHQREVLIITLAGKKGESCSPQVSQFLDELESALEHLKTPDNQKGLNLLQGIQQFLLEAKNSKPTMEGILTGKLIKAGPLKERITSAGAPIPPDQQVSKLDIEFPEAGMKVVNTMRSSDGSLENDFLCLTFLCSPRENISNLVIEPLTVALTLICDENKKEDVESELKILKGILVKLNFIKLLSGKNDVASNEVNSKSSANQQDSEADSKEVSRAQKIMAQLRTAFKAWTNIG